MEVDTAEGVIVFTTEGCCVGLPSCSTVDGDSVRTVGAIVIGDNEGSVLGFAEGSLVGSTLSSTVG